jgi:hypothetical protein
MELGDLASTSVVEVVLLLGGLLAVSSAVVGHKKERILDDFLVILGFIAGAVILIIGLVALTVKSGNLPSSTIIILFVLGGGLFLHLIKKIKWAALIALVVGVGIGYILYQAAKTFNITNYLTPTVIVIIAFVIMIIIYAMLKFFEDIISIAGGILSFRPVMFVAGLVAILESFLLFSGSSLSHILK